MEQEGQSDGCLSSRAFCGYSGGGLGKREAAGNGKARWAEPEEEALRLLKALRGHGLGPQEESRIGGVSHNTLDLLSLSSTPPRCPPGMAGCRAGPEHPCSPGLGSGSPPTICGAA